MITYNVKLMIAYMSKENVLVLKLKSDDSPYAIDEEEWLEDVSFGSRELQDVAGKVPVLPTKGVYTLMCEVKEEHTGGYSEPEDTEYHFEFVGHELVYTFQEEW